MIDTSLATTNAVSSLLTGIGTGRISKASPTGRSPRDRYALMGKLTMLKSKILTSLILIVSAGALILTTALARRQEGSNQESAKEKKLDKEKDFSRFPITDYYAPESLDPGIRAKRQAKGRKYDSKHMPPISETTDKIFSIAKGRWN